MSETVGDFLIRRLTEWDVKRIYGYPGDGINGIMGAMGRAGIGTDPKAKIEYVQVRHEEMAAFMACAHSKFTGEVGVCLATSGPGAIHLLNGLYDAKMDHQSVVAIVGQQARRSLGSNYQQEVDLAALFKDVASSRVLWAIWWKTSCHRQNGAAILCNSTVKPIQVTLKLRKCDMALLTTIAFPGGE